jgi:prevent-host-death family protein
VSLRRRHISVNCWKEVERGEELLLTRRGQPVARIVPIRSRETRTPEELMDAFREFREANRLDGVTIQELIEEGRRF